MASEQQPEEQVDYRTAQAEAKAAAARAKALRPWYKKKRFIIGGPIAAIVVLAVIGSLAGGTEEEPAAETAAAAASGDATSSSGDESEDTAAAEATPGIGSLIEVGSLNLTVLAVEPIDTTQYNMFNAANLRVQIEATNARGDADEEYNISQLYFKLVDTQGIAHDASFGCAECPDAISSVDLVGGGSVTGYVYFEFPADREPVELIYEPLFSTNKARIALK